MSKRVDGDTVPLPGQITWAVQKKKQYPWCAHACFSEKWFAKARVDGFCAGYADTISSRRRQNIGALLEFTSSRAATPGERIWHLAKGSVPLSVLESSQSCRTSESNDNRSGRKLRNTADYWFSLFCFTSWTTLPIILAGSLQARPRLSFTSPQMLPTLSAVFNSVNPSNFNWLHRLWQSVPPDAFCFLPNESKLHVWCQYRE